MPLKLTINFWIIVYTEVNLNVVCIYRKLLLIFTLPEYWYDVIYLYIAEQSGVPHIPDFDVSSL